MREPARMFVSYAPEDAEFFAAFRQHQAVLTRRGVVEVWHEGRLQAGAAFPDESRAQLDRADVVVLLVSAAFLDGERIWREHLDRALERERRGEVTILPVLIRAVHMDGAPFEGLQMLPRDGRPIADPGNDAAWKEVAEALADLLTRPDRDPRHAEERLPGDRPDEFRDRVERLCRLREKKPLVPCHAPLPFAALWEMETSQDPIEVKPIAALDGTPTRAIVEAFDRLLDERYRGEQQYLASMLIYRGPDAPMDLVRHARNQRGITLTSFEALNRLIDFNAYLERQRGKLRTDPVYPLDLYVQQHGLHVVGRDGRPVDNALDDLWGLLTDPQHPLFLLVLADFGTGKTFLLRQLAARLSEPGSAVVPVLVELRALEKARSIEALLMQHFALAGERVVDLDRFFHMLEQGRIALLFDGFDELVPRVTFDRAAEHLETLIEAARGRAKVVITSRTQHFLSDEQVKSALARRAERVPHRQLFKLLPFGEDQIREFLVRKLGSDAAARRRFELLGQVTDLLGLSRNPRMLSFIVEIDEQKLLAARDRSGAITKTELYTLLIERWLVHEFQRNEYRGVPTLFDSPARWRAVLALAERLWGTGEKGLDLRDLPEDLKEELCKLGPPDQEAGVKAQAAASGTLLVRDEEGRFSFLHRSILEFAAAWVAAVGLRANKEENRLLTATEMTDLMAEFFGDLATPAAAVTWAREVLGGRGSSIEKKNAQRVLDQLSPAVRASHERGRVVRVVRRNEILRGESFAGHDLREADFSGADLSEAVFTGADLTGANLSGARLVGADFERAILLNADLQGADLSSGRLLGAELRGAKLDGAVWRYARCVGARMDSGVEDGLFAAEGNAAFGAAPPHPTLHQPVTLPSLWRCNSVALSPDGALLISGHQGGTLILWSMADGEPLRVWSGHADAVTSVTFSPDGKTLASGSSDNSVRLWSLLEGASLRTLQGHSSWVRSVAFSPDGRILASGSSDNSVRLWGVPDGAPLRTLHGHSKAVSSVAFSPDGATLASGSHDTFLRVWSIPDGASLRTLEGHSRAVLSVAFSPDGETLASASDDTSVRLWSLPDGASIRTLQGHSQAVSSVTFSPDGETLVSGSFDNSVRLWDFRRGVVRTLQGHSQAVSSVTFSPDGETLVSGSFDNSVRLWKLLDGVCFRTMRGHPSSALSVAFGPDGKSLAFGGDDSSVHLWGLPNGLSLHTLRGQSGSVRSIAFSPDGEALATGSHDNLVRLWSLPDGTFLRPLQGHSDRVRSVAFSPDGKTLASGSHDNSVRLWSLPDGVCLRCLRGHSNSVRSVTFSPDGELLASGSADTSIRLWRLPDGSHLRKLRGHSDWVRSVTFSPDGGTLASGSDDTSVRLWSIPDGALLRTLRGHSLAVRSVTFSPDGGLLASGSDDTSVRLWSIADGTSFCTLQGHSKAVATVVFSPDGKLLASASYDNSIRLWSMPDGRCLAVLHATPTGWVAFTTDGRYRLSGDVKGSFWHVIGLCRFEPGELDPYFPDLRMRDDELLLPG